MARGLALELRCGACHSDSTFPTNRRGRFDLLGELYVSSSRIWMAWSGHYRWSRDEERNRLPGPRSEREADPGTTWRAIPPSGVQHECRTGGHRMVLTEPELWSLVRSLPESLTVLYLPADDVQSERVITVADRVRSFGEPRRTSHHVAPPVWQASRQATGR